ncbi:MAG: helix-turn-helix transcriptional regulator [Polyangiales bacterium]
MKSTLASRLRVAMGHAGVNQKQLEARARLSQGYTSRVLSGQRVHLDAVRIDRIAQACGVDFEWLSTGKGAMLSPRAVAAPAPAPASLEAAAEVAEAAVEEASPRGRRSPRAPERELASEEGSPLEEALAEAFRQGPYALADLDAVRGLVRNGAALLRDKEHLVDAARSWLAAAAALRKGGTPVTFATLAWQMSTLGAARGAEALARRDEAINREAHQELQGLGGEAPREAVRVPTRR